MIPSGAAMRHVRRAALDAGRSRARSSQFAKAWRLASIAVWARAGLAVMRGKQSSTAADAVELSGITPISEIRRSESARGVGAARRAMAISIFLGGCATAHLPAYAKRAVEFA